MKQHRFGINTDTASVLLIYTFLMCMIASPSLSQEYQCGHSGYLWGTDASATFEVFVDTEAVSLDFDWPQGIVDFRVKGYGDEPDELLIDQPLADGDVLTLIGPGIYYITIYSRWGSGCWEVTIEPTTIPEEDDVDDTELPADEMSSVDDEKNLTGRGKYIIVLQPLGEHTSKAVSEQPSVSGILFSLHVS